MEVPLLGKSPLKQIASLNFADMNVDTLLTFHGCEKYEQAWNIWDDLRE